MYIGGPCAEKLIKVHLINIKLIHFLLKLYLLQTNSSYLTHLYEKHYLGKYSNKYPTRDVQNILHITYLFIMWIKILFF